MKHRSVIEILVLTFTFVMAFSIVSLSVLTAVVEILDPKVDTSALVRSLTTIMTLILGALLGLLAGKQPSLEELSRAPEDEEKTGKHQAAEEDGEIP